MIHTNQELRLMLENKKPFAVFSKVVGESFDETGGQNFQRYVDEGLFIRKRFFVRRKKYNVRMLYTAYAVVGQEWRITMYKILMHQMEKEWNPEMEFLEGLLLGYNIQETVKHVKTLRKK